MFVTLEPTIFSLASDIKASPEIMFLVLPTRAWTLPTMKRSAAPQFCHGKVHAPPCWQ